MRILAIGAHPDDIELGCAGTLLKHRAEIHLVTVTRGEEGGQVLGLGKVRENEGRTSARAMGAASIEFLGLPDGLTSYGKEDRVRLIEIIRKVRPDRVFIHSSEDRNADHQVVHDLSLSAVRSAEGPWYPEAEGEPHYIAEIYGFEVWNPINEPGLIEDISDSFLAKLDLLRIHESQVAEYPYLEGAEGLAQYRGALISKKYAEAFEVIRARI